MKKDNLKGPGPESLDPIPIEGENSMFANIVLSVYYAILDFICFANLNTRSFQELIAKEVVL